ncbi:MAG TPA: alpha/beta hydrolase [Gammaproteobacteria bacterium]|nr:alpha/beta hydrolase [Gammaproteobacteria bacterium]
MKKLPLVLLPGLLSNQTVFQHQINQLSSIADIMVVELTDVDSPAAMTDKILKLVPERFMLAGHSIGGWVALRLMKIAPEKIIKLCILNTAARGVESAELASRQSVLDRIEKGEFKEIAFDIADKFTFNRTARAAVLKMFLQVGEQSLINQTRAMMLREDLRDILPTIHCPTWVVHAEQDQRFSIDMLKEISQLIPHSRMQVVQQCGHMSPMESPEDITNLMRCWMMPTDR